MTIYKVRVYVNRCTRRGTNKIVWLIRHDEMIIIDNLSHALSVFDDAKSDAQSFSYLDGYQGRAELFIPHIHVNGELAFYPDNEEYIDLYEFDRGQ